jgi:crotonobetainyl-CoA:carnitine CoA-transferase CaiB-like acyl-CoA transferase
VQFSGFKQAADRIPASIGADTIEVLRELGRSDDEIEELIAAGVVASAQRSEAAAHPGG